LTPKACTGSFSFYSATDTGRDFTGMCSLVVVVARISEGQGRA